MNRVEKDIGETCRAVFILTTSHAHGTVYGGTWVLFITKIFWLMVVVMVTC